MEGECCVARSINDQLPSFYMQEDQMEGESGVNRSIIGEL